MKSSGRDCRDCRDRCGEACDGSGCGCGRWQGMVLEITNDDNFDGRGWGIVDVVVIIVTAMVLYVQQWSPRKIAYVIF